MLFYIFFLGLGAFVLFNLWEYYQLYQDAQPLIVEGLQFSDILKGDFEKFPVRLEGNAQNIVNILSTPMVGASGAIFGVIAAFSLLYPNAEMFIMFIPFPIKAKVLFPISIIVSLYLGFLEVEEYCTFCTYWWRFSRLYFDKSLG